MEEKKKKIKMDDSIKTLLSSSEVLELNRVIKIGGKEYYPKKHVSSEGYKSVVWYGTDKYKVPVCIKLATYDEYINKPYEEELSFASKLKPYRQFAQLYDANVKEINLPEGKKYKIVCFIEEWVNGKTLKEFINEKEIEPSFILNYVRQMTEILNILKVNGLRHDDLHPGNVMLAKPQEGEFSQDLHVKIIDMGSIKDYNEVLKKEKDDLGRFTDHIIKLHNRMLFNEINRRKCLSTTDRRFRKELIPLINSMLEEDAQIALNDPLTISKRFQDAYERAKNVNIGYRGEKLHISDPFDYISAEHISNDELLVELFAESCPWIKEVTSPNPILLTGPRGCGKSMAFRWVSLKALLYKENKHIENSQIAGFYISCSSEFRNRFGWITSPAVVKKFEKTIIHYFNLLLCREIIQSLSKISYREDRETLFGFGQSQEKNLHSFLIKKLNIEERMLKLQGVKPIEHIEEIIDHEINFCYEQFVKRYNVESATSISFISDLTSYLVKDIVYFRDRKITFLVDDYSIHRISEPIQKILNPIIWDRQPTHIFKLSSEKYGAKMLFEDEENDGISPVESTREFREIDCGQYFISLNDKQSLSKLIDFSKELLNHRLDLAGYKGKCEKVIGNSKYDEGTLSKSLIENKKQDNYHGIETIAELCSGDISALLEIYREIFSEGRINENSTSTVDKKNQHSAIKRVSRRYYSTVRKYHPHGKEMHSICLSFGVLCRTILYKGKKMNGKKGPVPYITTRIEVDEKYEEKEEWSEEQKSLMEELVRRSIFIELEPSMGRNTFGPTLRWQLRRIYCPYFDLAMSRNVAIKWSMSEFKFFLVAPAKKCDEEWDRWSDIDQDQTNLYKYYPEFENAES